MKTLILLALVPVVFCNTSDESRRQSAEMKALDELKRMRLGRQTASSMLQSSQMAIRQDQTISFEEEREEDIDRRDDTTLPLTSPVHSGAPKKKKNQGCVGEWTSYRCDKNSKNNYGCKVYSSHTSYCWRSANWKGYTWCYQSEWGRKNKRRLCTKRSECKASAGNPCTP